MTPSASLPVPGALRQSARRALSAWPLAVVAVACVVLVPSTPLRMLGPLTVALMLGMALRGAPLVRSIPREGVLFVSREVLRFGVVLTAIRLDGVLLARAGAGPIVVAVSAIAAGFLTFAVLLRLIGVPARLGALLAIGTSVCGAAAITAARPVVNSSDEEAHIAIATVSVLGALFSVGLIVGLSLGWIPLELYGLIAGGALHEVAHVMAAATAAPSVVAIATVTKLTRVALLPLALVATPFVAPRDGAAYQRTPLRVPGLVIGFFLVSIAATALNHFAQGTDLLPAWQAVVKVVVQAATLLMASSMAAIGVLVDWKSLRRAGPRTLGVAVLGALILLGSVFAVASLWGHPAANPTPPHDLAKLAAGRHTISF
jgi:uncharacterized integral membrane protein (TIGR00698 family)